MTATSSHVGNFMALDVGTVRIGVAVASAVARLPHPHSTLHNDERLWDNLRDICAVESVAQIVVGLPRGLEGQETAQTAYCRQFADRVRTELGLPVTLQDEALTSHKASTELQAGGKAHAKEAIDALAATIILEDYLKEQR